MPDVEKVITALGVCRFVLGGPYCQECPYYGCYDEPCKQLDKDAVELLMTMQAVPPEQDIVTEFGQISTKYRCGNCKTPIERMDYYCRHCGKAVMWG